MLHLPRQPADEQALRCRAYGVLSSREENERPVELAGESARPTSLLRTLQARGAGAFACLLLLLAAALLPAGDRVEAHITAIRFWSLGDVTRIAIESDGDFSIRSDRLENPDRLFFDLVGAKQIGRASC